MESLSLQVIYLIVKPADNVVAFFGRDFGMLCFTNIFFKRTNILIEFRFDRANHILKCLPKNIQLQDCATSAFRYSHFVI